MVYIDKNFWYIVLVVVLVFVILYVSSSGFEDVTLASKLYNGDKWDDYRLGDVWDKHDIVPYEWDIRYHKDKFPDSIAGEYLKRNVPIVRRNKQLMLDIIRKRNYPNVLKPDDLVLHIRVGDIICEYSKKHEDWSRKYDPNWWNDVLGYISQNNIKKVYILAGAHKKQCLKESAEYLENRKKFLEENNPGLKVEYRVGQSPDEDVLFSAKANHFISTGGQYGMLLNEFRI
jgi:hypothetical protein